MKFKTLMVIKAIVCLALGVPILLLPNFTYSIFGVTLGSGGAIAAQEYGASLLGALMITWFARQAQPSDTRRAIALGYCVYDAIGAVVCLIATLAGVLNFLGWAIVLLYLFFAVGFGYFTVKASSQ
jgi:hypothetical protein